jgi:hypothetical protein
MKNLVLLFCLFSISLSSFTQILVPYKKGDLWGYTNLTGAILITPKYDKVDFFDNFGGKVWKDSLMGYINSNGNELVKPGYDDVIPITDSIYKVARHGKWTIIDVFGNKLIDQKYDGIYELPSYGAQSSFLYNKPQSTVRYYQGKNEGKYGVIIIDTQLKRGIKITPIKYQKIEIIRHRLQYDTLRYFKIKEDKMYGVIRVAQNEFSTFIKPQYESIFYSNYEHKYFCKTLHEQITFDINGKLLKKISLENSYSEVEETVDIDFDDLGWENRIHYPIFKELNPNGLQGLITTNRNKINKDWVMKVDTIPAIYDTIIRAYYGEECYIVSKNNKWGAVKPDGEYIVPPIYESFDIKSMIKQRKNSEIDRYRFIVKLDEKWGVVGNVDENGGISNKGYQLVPLIYESIIMDYGKDFYFLKLKGKFGVMSAKNYITIIKPKYAEISIKIKYYNGFKFFQVRPAKDSEYLYVGENGVEFFED